MNRETSQDQILRDLLRLLRRQRLLILAALLIAGAAAVAYSTLKTPIYTASADLQFQGEEHDLRLLGIPTAPPPEPEKVAAADAKVVNSPQVVRRVSQRVNLSEAKVRSSISIAVDPNTNLVTLKTSASDAKLAAQLANAFASQAKVVATLSERQHLHHAARRLRAAAHHQDTSQKESTLNQVSRLESLASFANPVQIVSTASVPGSPSSPKPVRDTLLALSLGLILGLLAAFLRDSLDRRLTDAHDIEHLLQAPMVGYIEADALGGVGVSDNGSERASTAGLEAFRILRSNVEFLAPDSPLRTVAVTSPVAEEGKSTVAAGLATASSLAGKRVLLVECDLRRPVFAERFGLAQQPGLTDWLSGSADPGSVVQLTRVGGERLRNGAAPARVGVAGSEMELVTMVAGSPSSHPAELLSSARFSEMLDQVSEAYDLVVLDCAPLLPVGDSLEILPLVDASLICIRLDQTTREQARAAKAALEHLPPRPTGVVITGIRPGREGYYYGYYSTLASGRSRLTSGAGSE